jgi:hypothetical protein
MHGSSHQHRKHEEQKSIMTLGEKNKIKKRQH